MQSKLRAEIRRMEAAIRACGDAQFTIGDFDAMPYMTAVIKVHNSAGTLLYYLLNDFMTRKD